MTKREVRVKRRRVRRTARCVVAVLVMLVLFVIASYIDTTYTREATVISIDNTTVTVVDTAGNEWVVDAEGLIVGQVVVLVMDNNCGSHSIEDDTIKNIKPADCRTL